jgi:hypothetical protein
MRGARGVLAAVLVIATCAGARAQSEVVTLSPAQAALACAPPPTLAGPPHGAFHIIGTQDSVARSVFGGRDLLVIDGGGKSGVSLGQQFFVRRASRSGGNGMYGSRQGIPTTVGWIHVVSLNDSIAIAQVDHMCDAFMHMDYLEPFAAPAVPPGIDSESTAEPDFKVTARVIAGSGNRSTFAPGDFALIDRGSGHGIAAGQHVAVYRDLGVAGMPLSSIGEAVVISTTADMALARITRVRDAIVAGDYAVPRR